MSDIKIYVADLAAYNNGKLHGVWIDATQDVDTIHDQIQQMLKASPEGFSEEWSLDDYEGFGKYRLEAYTSIETTHEIAVFFEEHGEAGMAALQYCNDLDEAKEMMEDHYHGCHDSEEDFAEQLFEDCYEIPDHLQYYIDYEKVARDLFVNDYVSMNANDGQIHVFSY